VPNAFNGTVKFLCNFLESLGNAINAKPLPDNSLLTSSQM